MGLSDEIEKLANEIERTADLLKELIILEGKQELINQKPKRMEEKTNGQKSL